MTPLRTNCNGLLTNREMHPARDLSSERQGIEAGFEFANHDHLP
jgi:hypothetical protein